MLLPVSNISFLYHPATNEQGDEWNRKVQDMNPNEAVSLFSSDFFDRVDDKGIKSLDSQEYLFDHNLDNDILVNLEILSLSSHMVRKPRCHFDAYCCSGEAGTGKTTFAQKLCAYFNHFILVIDDIIISYLRLHI